MRLQTSEEPRPPEYGLTPADIERAYRSHGHLVLRRAQVLLGNEAEAQEVLQEIFMALLRDPASFGGRAAMTTWLYRVTTNRCLNRMRNSKTRQRLLDEQMGPELGEPRQDSADTWTVARQFLDRMPDELAQVLVLHAVDGMTHKEISDVLGCSRRQVGNLIERAQAWARAQELE
ncbi:RNA polymerase sigma factor [Haliangium ochraceum]|uniref:RNA polymerase, sigma-24 subunit, ECF subfamily n=1 Tax=Haliangium ochraceum (strain DSM 14365 / JCM 11303 / SMP-2) TaxID=502025 RepID=D0LSB7_HALO1|nr:RNA polymerase sigma factor [Haliangium ochraceum]ACY15616.1 RNA polymerase, sigma-24 subunit, ECF subfamily [Haliangium ochraceum DSM 14365]